ncbi:flagellar biosynthetic protein FliO [Polaromonas sp. A23]|uniref:flagellar biosynthetic protein FliO n=1 Tax=Polaromonas sp. A23 TaxID=1944133 RepID=UPI0011154F77|nr:flagellar biosynthetic protein FliO [Polaromonas sp. A23]
MVQIRLRKAIFSCMWPALLALTLLPLQVFSAGQVSPSVEKHPLPFKVDATGTGTDEWRVLGTLLVLVGGAAAVLFFLRKRFPGISSFSTTGKIIKIVESRHISPRLALYLVEVGRDRILLAQSGDRITPLPLSKEAAVPDEENFCG